MKKYLKLMRNNTSGYTFVELLVVMVILAVLVAATANYLFAQGGSKARDTERKSEINQVAALVEQFMASYGEPPNGTGKNRKIIDGCKEVSGYKPLIKCFQKLKYIGGDGFIKLCEDPKEGIGNDKNLTYKYLYGSTNNSWKLCALLENQTDPDLNDDYAGNGTLGTEEGANKTYCIVSSNRNLGDIKINATADSGSCIETESTPEA